MKLKQGRIPLNFLDPKKETENFKFEKRNFIQKKSFFMESNFFSKEDPRPILDKNYLKACIQDIIFFLEKKKFIEPLNIELLLMPTNKNFFNILIFLLNEIDPNFDF